MELSKYHINSKGELYSYNRFLKRDYICNGLTEIDLHQDSFYSQPEGEVILFDQRALEQQEFISEPVAIRIDFIKVYEDL